MPDRGPVGWLPPEARKKKLDFINFLPADAFLGPNGNFIFIIYYVEPYITKTNWRKNDLVGYCQYNPLIGV